MNALTPTAPCASMLGISHRVSSRHHSPPQCEVDDRLGLGRARACGRSAGPSVVGGRACGISTCVVTPPAAAAGRPPRTRRTRRGRARTGPYRQPQNGCGRPPRPAAPPDHQRRALSSAGVSALLVDERFDALIGDDHVALNGTLGRDDHPATNAQLVIARTVWVCTRSILEIQARSGRVLSSWSARVHTTCLGSCEPVRPRGDRDHARLGDPPDRPETTKRPSRWRLQDLVTDLGHGRPTHEIIADALHRRIALGGYEPGESLPAERELAVTLGIGRATLRAALRLLTGAGARLDSARSCRRHHRAGGGPRHALRRPRRRRTRARAALGGHGRQVFQPAVGSARG